MPAQRTRNLQALVWEDWFHGLKKINQRFTVNPRMLKFVLAIDAPQHPCGHEFTIRHRTASAIPCKLYVGLR